jgi:hypothetical protein
MPAITPTPGRQPRLEAVASATPATLDALLTEALEPILVSFHTASREMLAPTGRELRALIALIDAHLHVVHVDVATYPDLAVRFKIRVTPTLLLFTHGVQTEFIVGPIPSRFLVATVSKALGGRTQGHVPGGRRVGGAPQPCAAAGGRQVDTNPRVRPCTRVNLRRVASRPLVTGTAAAPRALARSWGGYHGQRGQEPAAPPTMYQRPRDRGPRLRRVVRVAMSTDSGSAGRVSLALPTIPTGEP